MQWLKSFFGTKKQTTLNAVPISPVLDHEVPRYPPFMKGLPVVEPDRLLAQHPELLLQIKRIANALPEQYEQFYMGALRRFASYAHLLPASQGHHHRGAGGLLRHSMEVALWSLQGADNMLLQMGKTPAARRAIEPKWQLTAFLAGLCHDVGKPATDMTITNAERNVVWKPLAEDLYTWGARNRVGNYFIDWRNGRGKQHVSLSNILSERIIGTDALQWIDEGATELVVWLMEALNGSPGAANPLYDLVIRADSASVDRDLKTMGVAMAGYEIGVPIERHLMDIMRRLIKEGIWQVNELGARVWNINGGIYIVWPAGGDEIAEKVRIEDIKGMPRTADGILDMLCERNLAFVREGSDRYWKIVPDVLAAKIPNKFLACIRLRDDALISSTPIATVPGKLMNAEPEDEEADQAQGQEQAASSDTTAVDERAPTTAQQAAAVTPATVSQEAPPSPDVGQSTVEAPPEKTYRSHETNSENKPGKAKLTVDPETGEILGVESANPGGKKQPEIRELPKTHERSTSVQGISKPVALKIKSPAQSGSSETQEDPVHEDAGAAGSAQSTAPVEGASESAKAKKKRKKGNYQQKPELEFSGSVGELMLALADDLQRGEKKWGVDVLVDEQEIVLLRWPGCFTNYGLTAKTILAECTQNGWLWIDPDNPMDKLVDAKFQGEECKALKLMPDAGDALLYYAKYGQKAGATANTKPAKINRQDETSKPYAADPDPQAQASETATPSPESNDPGQTENRAKKTKEHAIAKGKAGTSPTVKAPSGSGHIAPDTTEEEQSKEVVSSQSPVGNIQTNLSLQAMVEIYRACQKEPDAEGTPVVKRASFIDSANKAGVAQFNRKQFNQFVEANSKVFRIDGLYLYCNESALSRIQGQQK